MVHSHNLKKGHKEAGHNHSPKYLCTLCSAHGRDCSYLFMSFVVYHVNYPFFFGSIACTNHYFYFFWLFFSHVKRREHAWHGPSLSELNRPFIRFYSRKTYCWYGRWMQSIASYQLGVMKTQISWVMTFQLFVWIEDLCTKKWQKSTEISFRVISTWLSASVWMFLEYPFISDPFYRLSDLSRNSVNSMSHKNPSN